VMGRSDRLLGDRAALSGYAVPSLLCGAG